MVRVTSLFLKLFPTSCPHIRHRFEVLRFRVRSLKCVNQYIFFAFNSKIRSRDFNDYFIQRVCKRISIFIWNIADNGFITHLSSDKVKNVRFRKYVRLILQQPYSYVIKGCHGNLRYSLYEMAHRKVAFPLQRNSDQSVTMEITDVNYRT